MARLHERLDLVHELGDGEDVGGPSVVELEEKLPRRVEWIGRRHHQSN